MLDQPRPSSTTSTISASAPVLSHVPNHRTAIPLRSSMWRGNRHGQTFVWASTRVPKITVSAVPVPTFSSTRSSFSSQTGPQAPLQAGHDSEAARISSLCIALSHRCSSSSCFGFLEDDETRYYIYTSTQQVLQPTTDISLEHLLSDGFQPSLSRRQRYAIALTIVSSYLQLRDSVWLQSSWSKSDISFHRDSNSANAIQLDRPYISRDFSSSTPSAKPSLPADSTFASLGIVLLELCFGKQIETHPIRLKLPAGDALTKNSFDLLAATDWSSGVGEEAGPDYAGAVQWCLLGSRTVPGGDAWRREFMRRVVEPMELCHRYLNPPKGS